MCVQSTATQNDLRNSMMLNGNQHQRDLFSGSLGIPDLTSHVGRVVHDFELMSRSRGASPTGHETHRSQRNSEVIHSPTIEQPYELHTISNAVQASAAAATAMGDSSHSKVMAGESGGVGAGAGTAMSGETSTGSDKRQQAYRKSDGNAINVLVQNPSQQIMKDRVHRFIDIPTPPPPPAVIAANLPPLSVIPQEMHDEFANNVASSAPRNVNNKFYFEKTSVQYNPTKHTLPRAQSLDNSVVDGNEMSEQQQFMPASQILRMNENVQRAQPASSSASKRNVTMARGKTFDDGDRAAETTTTTATSAATMQRGKQPKDSINANDYRRKLFGSHPNFIDYKVFNASTAIPANLNSAIFQTNYANIDFRENFDHRLPSKRFSQQHTHRRTPKNDSNNNYSAAERIYERPPNVSNPAATTTPNAIFSVATDSLGNRFLNRTNQINNSNNKTKHNANHKHSGNLLSTDAAANWSYQSNVDDQMLLRGTTVSQSFVKSMKGAERQKAFKQHSTHNSSSTSNGFKRSATSKPIAKRASRSYYRPQKYILNGDEDDDDDDYYDNDGNYEDELRARYTEYGSSATLATARPLSTNFKLSKKRFGFKQAKPV